MRPPSSGCAAATCASSVITNTVAPWCYQRAAAITHFRPAHTASDKDTTARTVRPRAVVLHVDTTHVLRREQQHGASGAVLRQAQRHQMHQAGGGAQREPHHQQHY